MVIELICVNKVFYVRKFENSIVALIVVLIRSRDLTHLYGNVVSLEHFWSAFII